MIRARDTPLDFTTQPGVQRAPKRSQLGSGVGRDQGVVPFGHADDAQAFQGALLGRRLLLVLPRPDARVAVHRESCSTSGHADECSGAFVTRPCVAANAGPARSRRSTSSRPLLPGIHCWARRGHLELAARRRWKRLGWRSPRHRRAIDRGIEIERGGVGLSSTVIRTSPAVCGGVVHAAHRTSLAARHQPATEQYPRQAALRRHRHGPEQTLMPNGSTKTWRGWHRPSMCS